MRLTSVKEKSKNVSSKWLGKLQKKGELSRNSGAIREEDENASER